MNRLNGKKIITILSMLILSAAPLSTLLLMADDVSAVGGSFGGGDGSAGNPYIIEDVDDLQNMTSDLNTNYTLANDIDASATSGWNSGLGFEPIGNDTARFNGTLEGNGYSIINLTVNRSAEDYVGLFGYLNDIASISNVSLVGNIITGNEYVGGFTGWNDGLIKNCNSTGLVIGTMDYIGGFTGRNFLGIITNCYSTGDTSGVDNIGGFVGRNDGTITNCYSSGTTIGDTYIGGFTGFNVGAITKCYSTGSTGEFSSSSGDVGGFVGWNEGGTITHCYNSGTTSGNFEVGGFVGMEYDGTITNCYNIGLVSGSVWTGGFSGYKYKGTIKNCFSTGNVSGSSYLGGFIGHAYYSVTITNCYSTGNIRGYGNYLGGFIGEMNDVTITNCYSTGNVRNPLGGSSWVGGFVGYNNHWCIISNCYSTGTANGKSLVGGFSGDTNGTITNCFWDNETSGLTVSDGGTVKNTTEMQQKSTFTNWDFSSVWEIYENRSYPFLTPIELIITTQSVNIVDTALEDVLYVISFDSMFQPIPTSNKFENWTMSTNTKGWLTINSTSGVLTGTPLNTDVGTWYVNVSISDRISKNGSFNYTITVKNTAPMITTPDITSVIATNLYTHDYNSTDDFQGTILWSMVTNATWLSPIIKETGIIWGEPTKADIGSYWIKVSVDDGNGGTDSTNFTLVVKLDTDLDGIPDDTDPDDDNDGTPDTSDDFPLDPMEDTDTDGDGTGNNADTDDDDDNWTDDVENVIGTDPRDNTSMPSDIDDDGIADQLDDDMDGDSYDNFEDAFPDDDTEWNDTDNDRIGDNADTDDDGDGTSDTEDDFPMDPTEDTDTDNDGLGDNVDTDDDNDGWNDLIELVIGSDPNDNTTYPPDMDGDNITDELDDDMDGDGVNNTDDQFPSNPSEWQDSDNDGMGDNADIYPLDFDNDGVPDDTDAFPFDPTRWDSEVVNNTVYKNSTIEKTVNQTINKTIYNNQTIDNTKDIDDIYLGDRDSDGLPDSWELLYGLNPDDPGDASSDLDDDGSSNLEEYVAQTSPTESDIELVPDETDDTKADKGVESTTFYGVVALFIIIILILIVVLSVKSKSKPEEKGEDEEDEDQEDEE